MKRTTSLTVLTIVMMGFMTSCLKAQPTAPAMKAPTEKILIVYLSRTKNTKAVAEMIRSYVGGNLVELELQNPYPENYKQIVDQVAKENSTTELPLLKTKISAIEQYDKIFVGFPTWGMELPPPMKSFLKHSALKGKTVIPFNTNAGYGIGNSFNTLKKLCPGSKVLDGFTTKGGIERDGILFVMKDGRAVEVKAEVQEWLKKIGMLN
ncbi:flavodoxin family protein [Pedobacter sp. AW31-3R]|uniref:flavodoxin family protein n=1 Tax=Pedobacter sp. AW31-3R TaxID=3445781 RepID=UPI003F9F2D1F